VVVSVALWWGIIQIFRFMSFNCVAWNTQVAKEIWIVDKGLHKFKGDIMNFKMDLRKVGLIGATPFLKHGLFAMPSLRYYYSSALASFHYLSRVSLLTTIRR
jgi:hypothetical protein